MADFRKYIIIFIITVLFSVFVFSFNAAVNEGPKQQDSCNYNPGPTKPYYPGQPAINCTALITEPTTNESKSCQAQGGYVSYNYDSLGCPTDWFCETCNVRFQEAEAKYKFWQFIIAAAFGLVAIIVGLSLPSEPNTLSEWLGTGFLLGGLVTLFIGTALNFSTFYKWLRPLVILVELLLVIFIAYRKLKTRK